MPSSLDQVLSASMTVTANAAAVVSGRPWHAGASGSEHGALLLVDAGGVDSGGSDSDLSAIDPLEAHALVPAGLGFAGRSRVLQSSMVTDSWAPSPSLRGSPVLAAAGGGRGRAPPPSPAAATGGVTRLRRRGGAPRPTVSAEPRVTSRQ